MTLLIAVTVTEEELALLDLCIGHRMNEVWCSDAERGKLDALLMTLSCAKEESVVKSKVKRDYEELLASDAQRKEKMSEMSVTYLEATFGS